MRRLLRLLRRGVHWWWLRRRRRCPHLVPRRCDTTLLGGDSVRTHDCQETSCRIARFAAVEGLNRGASIHDDADIAGRTEQQVYTQQVWIRKRGDAWWTFKLCR